jgi:hypothetical protein
MFDHPKLKAISIRAFSEEDLDLSSALHSNQLSTYDGLICRQLHLRQL